MRIVMFTHSLRSDWNHRNAHFLRGIATELVRRGHEVHAWEAADAWSARGLAEDQGAGALDAYAASYPLLQPRLYDSANFDVEAVLDGADLVLVHEWNDPRLVAAAGLARARGGSFVLLFHDTHHRAVTWPAGKDRAELAHYDGVLAFGSALRDLYLERGWARQAWTWHEAADTWVFRPVPRTVNPADLVWVGNWGDNERAAELQEFLVDPVRVLRLRASAYGAGYPAETVDALERTGIRYGGYVPNFRTPHAYARHRVTVHVPRWPYTLSLHGIPTIRVFEALACGIPLVSAPWDDTEALFRAGTDYLMARNATEMRRHLHALVHDDAMARTIAGNGRRTILARHTCAHRVDELMRIVQPLAGTAASAHDGTAASAPGGTAASASGPTDRRLESMPPA
jgi:spore maturation protein CgeB